MAVSAELGLRLETVVETLVASGRYNSKSEVQREGVRLVAGLAEAESGHLIPSEDVFAELRTRYDTQTGEAK